MAEEKTEKTGEIKSDKLYEGDLSYGTVRKNPILQPILEINSLYESHGFMVQKATTDYESLMKEINEMLRLNSDYSSTMIVAKFQQILLAAKQTIHAQDLQRIFMKKAMNEMVKINGKYFTPVDEIKDENEEVIRSLDEIIKKKKPESELPKEIELDEVDEVEKIKKEKKEKKEAIKEEIIWDQDQPEAT